MHRAPVEIQSEELDDFLTPRLPKRLLGRDLHEAIRRSFERFDLVVTELPPELLPHRIAVMWRLVRGSAIVKGMCGEEESLESATNLTPTPWTHPTGNFAGPAAQTFIRRRQAGQLLDLHSTGQGLPLLPVGDMEQVTRWCHAAAILSKELDIADTDAGLAGLQHLIQPKLAQYNDVTEPMVIKFEELVVEATQAAIFAAGEREAAKHIRTKLGLSRKEARGAILLARSSLVDEIPTSVETDRAFMVAQLREQIAAAKAAMNLDLEFKAMKLLAMVQGLTRSEPENAAKEFLSVVQRVSRSQDDAIEAAQAKGEVPLLEAAVNVPGSSEYIPPAFEYNEPISDEEQAALNDYDKEN